MSDDKIINWWDATEAEIGSDPQLAEARRVAYYNVFYATEMGRQVNANLRKLAGGGCWGKACAAGLTDGEFLVLSSFIAKIKENAGACDEMAAINAECVVAAGNIDTPIAAKDQPKEEVDLLET